MVKWFSIEQLLWLLIWLHTGWVRKMPHLPILHYGDGFFVGAGPQSNNVPPNIWPPRKTKYRVAIKRKWSNIYIHKHKLYSSNEDTNSNARVQNCAYVYIHRAYVPQPATYVRSPWNSNDAGKTLWSHGFIFMGQHESICDTCLFTPTLAQMALTLAVLQQDS